MVGHKKKIIQNVISLKEHELGLYQKDAIETLKEYIEKIKNKEHDIDFANGLMIIGIGSKGIDWIASQTNDSSKVVGTLEIIKHSYISKGKSSE